MNLLEVGIWMLERERAGDCLAELINDYNLLCAKLQGTKSVLLHTPAIGLQRLLDAQQAELSAALPGLFEGLRALGAAAPSIGFRELKNALASDHQEDCLVDLVMAHTALAVKMKKMIPAMVVASQGGSAVLLQERIQLHEEFALAIREFADEQFSPRRSPEEKCGKWAV